MIIILLLIGLILIILNLKAVNKERSSFKSVLQDKEENITETEIIVGELRREFSETILELQKEIIELKEALDKLNNFNESTITSTENKILFSEAKEKDESTYTKETIDHYEVKDNSSPEKVENFSEEKSNGVKVDEVGRLLKEGISIDEICEKLSIGKGEVLLIKELYLK